jgi:hypothetical protein
MQALWISRESCREFALRYSWENSAGQFISHARKVAMVAAQDAVTAGTNGETVTNGAGQTLVPGCNTRVTHEHTV